MDIMEAMEKRHSVRQYKDIPIEPELVEALRGEIDEINKISGLNIQLITDEPEAFSGMAAKYGSFQGCKNYFAICAENGRDEEIGYFGERLVLFAQSIGLHTCWVALTYSKGKVPVELKKGEKLQIVISVGHGKNRGVKHKDKPMETLCTVNGEMPQWFKNAMRAAMLAPTAVNQQKFHFTLNGNKVKAKAGLGPCAKMDLGIVKYHFEIGAGDHKFEWE